MSKGGEDLFAARFREVVERYIESFAHAHDTFGAAEAVIQPHMDNYVSVLSLEFGSIYDKSRESIVQYLESYHVGVKDPDIWKMLYFIGRQIEHRLRRSKTPDGKDMPREVALIHLTAMVVMLDVQLKQSGLDKKLLREALLRLVQNDKLFQEMGETGTYLVYKTLSTWKRDLQADLNVPTGK